MSSSAAGSSFRLAAFLAHPEARPLPTFGPCQVTVCTRQAHGRRGLCRAHDCRWWEQERAGKITRADFGAWCRSSAPVASGHEVILRGLAPLVQAQILFGLQERCRFGAVTYLYQLRIFCRRLLAGGCATIAGFSTSPCFSEITGRWCKICSRRSGRRGRRRRKSRPRTCGSWPCSGFRRRW